MSFLVKAITDTIPKKHRSLCFRDDVFIYKGFWRRYTFPLSELVLIEGYSETTMGLEEVCCIDMIFKNGKKLLFDGSDVVSLLFINDIIVEKLKVEPLVMAQPFWLSVEKMILYQKG